MSSPFTTLFPNGIPAWSGILAVPGNFTPVNILGSTVTAEVGFGQGGFGVGGYDAPSGGSTPASTPIWTTGSSE